MCGIVAAVAQRDVAPLLIAGLKALEYRGYDSSGLAVLDRGAIRRQFETRFTARRMALDYLDAYRSLTEKAEPHIRLVSSAE